MTKETLKLALEALEVANSCVDGYYIPKGKTQLPEVEEAITAIKKVLAQPEQEPVEWPRTMERGALVQWLHFEMVQHTLDEGTIDKLIEDAQAIPATPPQRTWVGLTDEEIDTLWQNTSPYYDHQDFARAIETKLKERNT